jgi:hypothetical protein
MKKSDYKKTVNSKEDCIKYDLAAKNGFVFQPNGSIGLRDI